MFARQGKERTSARHRQAHARQGERDAQEDGDPLEAEWRYEIGQGEGEDPQRARRRLHPFADVVHGPVALQDLADDP
jgi:hypothetical protein